MVIKDSTIASLFVLLGWFHIQLKLLSDNIFLAFDQRQNWKSLGRFSVFLRVDRLQKQPKRVSLFSDGSLPICDWLLEAVL